jgi:hypothetical protein
MPRVAMPLKHSIATHVLGFRHLAPKCTENDQRHAGTDRDMGPASISWSTGLSARLTVTIR